MNNLLRKITIGSVILGMAATALPAFGAISAGCKANLSTCTSAELTEYIAELTASLTALQTQLGQQTTTPTTGGYDVPAGFTFTKNLSAGMSNPDVVNLKKVLDVEVSDHVAWTGSQYFGVNTKAAVVEFQQEYSDEISEFAGYTIKASGFVGTGTRAQLNALLSAPVTPPVTPPITPPTGCNCTDWANGACGTGDNAGKMQQTRTCTPSACALESQYVTDATCVVTPVDAGLTVALAADTPAAATIVADSDAGDGAQTLIPFAKVKLTNGDASEVKVTTLKFTRKGISSDTDLSNVYLYEGDTRLAEMISFSSKVVTFSNSAGLVAIPAGGSKTLTLKGDLINQASAGKTIGFELAVATDVSSGASAVNGTFPLSGNLMSTANVSDLGKLTVTHSSYPASIDPSVDTERELWRFSLQASSQKVKVSYLKFTAIGTADAAAFKEINLYVAGVKVAGPVEMASDKTVAFDMSAAPVELTSGQTKSVTLNGKVVGGAGRNFYFSFQKSADIVVYDSGYGVYLKPNGQDVFTIVKASAVTTINQGSLTVTRSSDTPSGNVALAGTNVSLACFDFKAAGENIKVTSLPAHLTFSTATKKMANVYLTVDGSQIGTIDSSVTGDGAEDIGWGSFGNALIVQAGATAKVCIKGNIVAASGAAFAANDTVLASLEAGTENAQRMTSGTTLSTPAYDGFQLTIKSGAVNVAKNLAMADAATTTPSGVRGSAGVKIGSFVVTAGAAEAVNVTQIVLKDNVSGSGVTLADYFQNLTLKDSDGNQIGTIQGTLTDTDDTTYSFTPSGTLSISASQQKVFNVFVDVKTDAATGTLATPVLVDAVYAYGVTTSQTSDDTASDPTLQTVYIAANASLTITKDAGAPAAAILVMGDTAQVMTKIKFEETTKAENVEVTQIVLTDTIGGSAATSSVTNITIESGTFTATKTGLVADGTVTFDLTASPWVIPAGSYKVLTVKVNIAQYPDCTSAGTHTLKIAAGGVTAKGAVSKTSVGTVPSSAQGDVAMITYRTKLTASGIKTAYTAAARGVGTEVLQFSTAANANYDAALHQIEFTNSGSDTTPGTGGFSIYDSSNLSTPLIVISNKDLSATGTATTTTSTTTTVTVDTTTDAALMAGHVIKVGSEYMLVTKNASTTDGSISVLRGWAGSTAAVHSGATVDDGDLNLLAKTGVVVPVPTAIASITQSTDWTSTGYTVAAANSKTFIVKGDTSAVGSSSQSINIKIDSTKIGWRDGVQTSNITSLTPGLPIEGSVTFN